MSSWSGNNSSNSVPIPEGTRVFYRADHEISWSLSRVHELDNVPVFFFLFSPLPSLSLPSTSSSSQTCLTKDAPLSKTASSSTLRGKRRKTIKCGSLQRSACTCSLTHPGARWVIIFMVFQQITISSCHRGFVWNNRFWPVHVTSSISFKAILWDRNGISPHYKTLYSQHDCTSGQNQTTNQG